jgi:hypothetical protein
MKELRTILLWALLMGPLVWSVSQGIDSPVDGLNRGLSALYLGGLPVLALALLFAEDFFPKTLGVRLGADRRRLVGKLLIRKLLALVGVALGGSILLIVSLRGLKDPLLLRDLLSTASIAVAASVSLLLMLSAARAWLGRPGLLGFVFLGWLIGPSDLAVRILLPSGHIRSLLGLGQQLPLAGWHSFFLLYALSAVSLILLRLRVPR